MAATERDIREQMASGKPVRPSLLRMAFKALGDTPLTTPGFFNARIAPCPDLIKRNLLEDLLHYAGFGMRTKAETIFRIYPSLLVWRGKLTDIAKMTYEKITAFEYAVLVKDSYFVRKVVDFLETYHGEDKRELVTNLLEQFDRCFNRERLAAVNGFIEASDAWRAAFLTRNWPDRDRHFVQDVGESQAKFPAHILQEYCHPTRSFEPTPKFSEAELPECLDFYNCNNRAMASLLAYSPGGTSNFALLRAARCGGVGGTGGNRDVWERAGQQQGDLEIDCVAMDALDRARTTDLLALRERLAAILTADDSLTPNAPMPGCSSSVPS
ncbi:hypothetical protein [Legionella quateirensis]|uniref:SidC homolog n=1 Tax=Legionella quateirensis TaxID=45072 RepID=A0A378KTP5_9GAMM|nr:hypothetical protein [Legionella quateirensis]KTD44714.1 hypothetical protein Lqua_2881 [Legionella quateirensis]STY16768.1 SidC homolog [Legionella quateirensis]